MQKMHISTGSKWFPRVILMVLILVSVGLTPGNARAFEVPIHEDITADGLAQRNDEGGFLTSFLRPAVFEDIKNEHYQMDHDEFGLSGAEDQKHFDDCEFNGAVDFINGNHFLAAQLAEPGGDSIPFFENSILVIGNFSPWDATDAFGSLLHTTMDFYAHSNWVELGFPVGELDQTDLVDLSGAPYSNLQDWSSPPPLGSVRGDILLHSDDGLTLPSDWSVDENFPSSRQATIRDGNGQVVGRFLTTGTGAFDDECTIPASDAFSTSVWEGFHHDDLIVFDYLIRPGLHKDGVNRTGHYQARALATLQTSYEWCRFIYKTGLLGGEGLPLALWVRPDGSPHPQLTPCAPEPPGPKELTVTIESVKVLDSGDDSDNQPGEVNLVLVAYDSPFAFHRSESSQGGAVQVSDGEFVEARGIPAPVTLCLGNDETSFRLAVHGWDDDDDVSDPYYGDFDDIGDDDEVILGFQKTWIGNPPSGTQTAISEDMQVAYRIDTNTDKDGDGLGDCDEQIVGSDPNLADSDNDSLTDGTEVNGSNPTNPLDSDTDDDGLTDGQEDINANGALDAGETDPNDVDSDDDGLSDGVEVNGSNPTNPLDSDSDNDGLTDGQEDTNSNGALDSGETNPNDADSDDDGLSDGVEADLGTDPLDPDTDDDELLDGQEVSVGTDPLDPDSDDDGILDGEDVEWLQEVIMSLPPTAFKSSGQGLQTTLLSILNDVERFIARGQNAKAIQMLQSLRTKVDGCGATPDQTDWIMECATQIQIRDFLDLLIINLH